MSRRLYVLGGVLAAVATLAAVILFEVLGTVFLALSVAYLLVPLRRRLRGYGFSRLTSTLAVTATAVGGVLALFGPLGYLLIVRFSEVRAVIRGLPESIPLGVGGLTYELVVSDAITVISRELTALAGSIAASLPVLLIKLTLFVLLVFSLLHNQQDIRSNVLTVVPPNYRDIAEALHTRARETLFALYVLQAATAVGTFLIALPVFVLFGYSSPIVLATTAGILQFVPIAGPSLLIVVLVGGRLVAGDVAGALAVGLIAGGLIAWLPDLLIRPRLASRTADLSGSLYFIGFVGGLLSLGAIGIIVGPLVVALLVEAASLVSREFEPTSQTPVGDDEPGVPPEGAEPTDATTSTGTPETD
ncbi:AI-2E family transporter [Halohasta salina]|uniref:AI-2E family transporter n=1 Tax=Halohasta salina TaxID=2961621 RepID=UPI0020A2EC9D|nr:AI-2E family transporter [Halohasta salina]